MRNFILLIGITLIIIGGVLLLNQMGFLNRWGIDLGALIFPIIIILIGFWILVGVIVNRGKERSEQLVIQRRDSSQADIRIKHGAGRVKICAGEQTELLLEGTFGGGVVFKDNAASGLRIISLDTPIDAFWRFPMIAGFNWDMAISSEITINLDISTGAGESFLDLERLNLSGLRIKTGAGETRVTLPAHPGSLHAEIQTGVGELILTVPENVAARFNTEVGLGDFRRDRTRFVRVGSYVQTEDFDQAQERVDIKIKSGIGSVIIR